MSKCPECDHPQTCPCSSCQERNPTDKPWVYVTPEGDVIMCANCGLLHSENWWAEQEYKQMEEEEK